VRLLIVGYGKMGRLVDRMATDQGIEIAGRVDVDGSGWTDADVAVDFTTADALLANFPRYLERRLPVVIGTTGWSAHETALRSDAERAGVGVVAAPNFSIGVNLFESIVREAARLLKDHRQYGAWIHEAHHSTKRDAPSGTALILRDTMIGAGYQTGIDMSSTRAGQIPGVHTIGFDGASDTIELTHRARDRGGFASGAILAARWLQGKRGWYSMRDVLGISSDLKGTS
jgi:4-hydroxy-tetrahydrodipicolinate reductase